MKIVFYLTDEGVTAYDSRSEPGEIFEFVTWDDIANLDSFLSAIPEKAEAEVVLDLVEEDLYFEWSPKVMPWEKGAIIKRRNQRLQSESVTLTEVKWTGASHTSDEGRKEELLLAATITDSFNVSSFLAGLEQAQIIVTAIHSKPFLLESYFQKWIKPHFKLSRADAARPILLVTRQSENTYRQTFLYDGQVRLSRLIELDKQLSNVDEIRKALVDETKLAVTYVYNQKIVPYNSPIGYLFLDNDTTMLEGLIDVCKTLGLIRESWQENEYFVATGSYAEIAQQVCVCQHQQLGCYSPQAIVDFVIAANPKGFYHTDYVNKVGYILQGRKTLIALNMLVFLGGLYYILISGVDTLVSWQRQEMLDQSIVEHQVEAKRLEKMVKLQDDAQRIKASVEFSEAILKLKVNRLINFDIDSLSQVFARHRNIQLTDIDWKTLDRFDSNRNEIKISGWVFPFYETYKKPVQWVDEFVADLQNMNGAEVVDLQKEPLNRRLNQALNIRANPGDTRALAFSVVVRVKDGKSN
ncbi:hypothetical protein [Thiomicrorhabdus sediminis]|uniref:Uncharacterized protein n=1 Tax=Thiomicrorhabdus sediminis TaxID=2580412 RepID=A0A4P9K6Q1_9GAMM|nr:hypothetical protein [Thiomicrorhabdus sediminis]QCU90689.1 hypothetical protein FE785_08615 [Thiomicrorhabdus sediminis]